MNENTVRVLDVNEASFPQEVLQRSFEVPVVVDFWAPWCGPCRTLGPILERLAERADGEFRLVKLNTDENPSLAARFGIRGIPAVKAFRDGRVVDEFVGALPEAQVRAWLDRIRPSEADRLAKEGLALVKAGYLASAEDRFREALTAIPDHLLGTLALARLLTDRGDFEEAKKLLRRIPGDPEAARMLSELNLKAGEGADVEAARRQVAEAPDDPGAHFELGHALAAREEYEEALEALIASVRLDKHLQDDAARKTALEIFKLLGDQHPLTVAYRRRLSNLLF